MSNLGAFVQALLDSICFCLVRTNRLQPIPIRVTVSRRRTR